MKQKSAGILITLSLLINAPSVLHATRGPEDYGIVMAIVFMFFTMPVGILLLSLNLFMFSRLKSAAKPRRGQGKAASVISIITLVLSTVLPVVIMHWSGWNDTMVELMLAVFAPVIVLSVLLALLSRRVRKRSLEGDGDRRQESASGLH